MRFLWPLYFSRHNLNLNNNQINENGLFLEYGLWNSGIWNFLFSVCAKRCFYLNVLWTQNYLSKRRQIYLSLCHFYVALYISCLENLEVPGPQKKDRRNMAEFIRHVQSTLRCLRHRADLITFSLALHCERIITSNYKQCEMLGLHAG